DETITHSLARAIMHQESYREGAQGKLDAARWFTPEKKKESWRQDVAQYGAAVETLQAAAEAKRAEIAAAQAARTQAAEGMVTAWKEMLHETRRVYQAGQQALATAEEI